MKEFIVMLDQMVWGVPMLLLILGTGMYICVKTRFIQIRLFPAAVRTLLKRLLTKDSGGTNISPVQALCTALAATVGTGNIAGVAGAIAIGGPGAVFWMWASAFFGMGLKFAEACLSVRFRKTNQKGELVSGPMYMIEQGMGSRWRWLAALYCFFGVFASLGVGNATQINTLIVSVSGVFASCGMPVGRDFGIACGIALAILIGLLMAGGIKRIGFLAEKMVPIAGVLYVLLGLGVLLVRIENIPAAFRAIVCGAFNPAAFTGGIVGSAIRSLRVGTARGVFTNEAGMGTAGIAHGSAEGISAIQQGMMGLLEVFIDTFLICTVTALVILCSGVPVVYGQDIGIDLTASAFSSVYGNWIRVVIALCVCAFSLATVVGWGLYGGRCAQYLIGDQAWRWFVVLQSIVVVVGAVVGTGTIWTLAEIVNGLMAIPNLICILYLTPELCGIVRRPNKSVDFC